MAAITIPFDYDEHTHPGVIPICIGDMDEFGNKVHVEWIEHGVVPVKDKLVATAGRLLGNKMCASEIAEYAVHSLSRTRGNCVGDQPGIAVLSSARWHALNLKAGGRRNRRKLDVELFTETLEALEEQYDFAEHLEATQILDKIVAELDRLGLEQVKQTLPWMLRNADGHDLSAEFGQKRNTITTRFYRGMRKAAKAAHISWR